MNTVETMEDPKISIWRFVPDLEKLRKRGQGFRVTERGTRSILLKKYNNKLV